MIAIGFQIRFNNQPKYVTRMKILFDKSRFKSPFDLVKSIKILLLVFVATGIRIYNMYLLTFNIFQYNAIVLRKFKKLW
jgi:hypothetical protein